MLVIVFIAGLVLGAMLGFLLLSFAVMLAESAARRVRKHEQ